MDVLAEIRKKYPQLSYLFNDPQVGALLRDAVDPAKGFSPEEFQARLYNTNWFKRQSVAQRQWDILAHTDPAEAGSRRAEARDAVGRTAGRLGIRLSSGEIAVIAEGALQRGWDLNGGQLLEAVTTYGRRINRYTPGLIDTTARKAQAAAAGDYYVAMSHKDAMHWGDWIARGVRTEQDLQQELQNRALSRYRWLEPELKAGKTMEQIFGGHRSLIAQTLEIAPDSIDFTKGKWAKVLGIADAKTGQTRPMSLYEAQVMARQDDRWWGTANGQAADAQMATTLSKVFGKRA